MSEANKAISRRFIEDGFNKGNMAAIDEIVAPGHTNSGPGSLPGLPPGPEGSKQIISVYRNAFPDLQLTVDDVIAEGDKVVTRWTGRGTHKGELAGIPPTGKTAVTTGMGVDRIVNGKIVESWGIFDQLGMLTQLGVVPPPPGG
ncbi:MAG: ester cyclase [Chloroflexi bacterium]|nr:ester cyclase [Chloroflexota bacterium]MBI3762016.1 ester cyclase [Chloroflexota bacterium]